MEAGSTVDAVDVLRVFPAIPRQIYSEPDDAVWSPGGSESGWK